MASAGSRVSAPGPAHAGVVRAGRPSEAGKTRRGDAGATRSLEQPWYTLYIRRRTSGVSSGWSSGVAQRGLTRQAVVQRAILIGDREGLAAVSFRRLGQELSRHPDGRPPPRHRPRRAVYGDGGRAPGGVRRAGGRRAGPGVDGAPAPRAAGHACLQPQPPGARRRCCSPMPRVRPRRFARRSGCLACCTRRAARRSRRASWSTFSATSRRRSCCTSRARCAPGHQAR